MVLEHVKTIERETRLIIEGVILTTYYITFKCNIIWFWPIVILYVSV
jgi:hypothetical protein